MRFLITDTPDTLNHEIAVALGMGPVTTKAYAELSWCLFIKEGEYVLPEYTDDLVAYDDLTPEQKAEVDLYLASI